jgi:antitoxin (DNA-binding transcriptional repressor) of toxin-antitoxin stability system
MKSLNASEFREQCLSLLDHLPPEGIVIMKRGQPVARLVPVRKDNADLIGSLRGQFQIHGDILSTEERWDAES